MERTLKPWEIKGKPLVIDERPWGARSKSSRNNEERSLQETFLQSLKTPAHKRNPQRDVIKASSRPIVSTGTSKNRQTQRSIVVPLSCSRLDVPVSHFRSTSGTQSSEKTSTLPPDLTSRPPSPIHSEIVSVVARPVVSPAANAVEDERSSPPPSYEVTEWTAFLDRIQRNPSSATYEVRKCTDLRPSVPLTPEAKRSQDLLLLEEVNGPSSSSSARRIGHGVSNKLLNASVGLIQLLHRRTTKDGKAKLKMVLAGQRVERCGICLAQFKSGESGALTDCSHAFHESCLLRWVTQSASCPMCRVALAPD